MKTKQITFLALLLGGLIFIASCEKNDLKTIDQSSNDKTISNLKVTPTYCGDPVTFNLWDFYGDFNPGMVTIGNDGTDLYVTIEMTGDWLLENTYWYIGTAAGAPATINGDGTIDFGNGNVTNLPNNYYAPGAGVSSYQFTTALSTLPDCYIAIIYVKAVNAANPDGVAVWAKNNTKPGGFWVDYCTQSCNTPPPLGDCETAYAWGGDNANCFLGIAGVNSNNWGWSNGPLSAGDYEFDIYAGAGQCNLDHGTLVGTLDVSYDGSTVTVTYNVVDGVVLTETHLYVGNDILPTKHGHYTTAPGQFPYKHHSVNAQTDSFTVNGLSGDIYIAAHSGVCPDSN